MTLLTTVREKITEHAAEAAVASVSVLLIWVAHELAPLVLALVDKALSNQILLALLFASLLINGVLVYLVVEASKKAPFRLRYGVYWDAEKNPYCPTCKTPLGAYDDYMMGKGYYCKPCNNVVQLSDATGKRWEPAHVIKEL